MNIIELWLHRIGMLMYICQDICFSYTCLVALWLCILYHVKSYIWSVFRPTIADSFSRHVTPSIGYTWSVMALQFENVNLFLHLWRPFGEEGYHYKYRCMVIFIPQNIWEKVTTTSIDVWWYLSHKIYGKNNQYIWQVEISADN